MGTGERPVFGWCSINNELKNIYSLFYTSLYYLKFISYFCLIISSVSADLRDVLFSNTSGWRRQLFSVNQIKVGFVLILADFYFCLNWFTCRGEMVMTLSFKTFQNKTCTINIKHFFWKKLPFFRFFYIHLGPTTLSDLGQFPWTRVFMLMFTYTNNEQLIKFE